MNREELEKRGKCDLSKKGGGQGEGRAYCILEVRLRQPLNVIYVNARPVV